jgi:fermentation-respiration switch protein FrsA (DUF1100 family)
VSTLVLILLAGACIVGLLAVGCADRVAGLPFFPSKTIHATPADFGLACEETRIATKDGETLDAWFIPAADANKAGSGVTLLFFHGNGGNISHCLDSLVVFHRLGLRTLIVDYRGYGRSTGQPSVQGTLLDAEAAWDWLLREKQLTPDQIVIHGRSLGGGVAAHLAARVAPRGLILESTFTSLRDVAEIHYGWAPLSLLLPQDYDIPGTLAGMRFPLLVVHSPDDELVPYTLGQAIYQNYEGPKTFLRLNGSHNAGFLRDRENYAKGLRDFLKHMRFEAALQEKS